jgi:hypothetical protein
MIELKLYPRVLTLAVIAMTVVIVIPVSAQVDTGVIEVAVIEQEGDVVPGVALQAINDDTGLRRATFTDSQGSAVFPALLPGTYSVIGELDGFAPVRRDEVVLRVGQTIRLELTMRLQVTDTITVSGNMPLVDIYRTDSATNVVPEQIEQLPVADRNYLNLAFITPGVQRERSIYRFIQGGPVIGGGGNASVSAIFVDGVDFTDQSLGLDRAQFSQDAIRELRVISNRFDTEIGGSVAGALSVVTKSGTNQVHGSAFGFFRSDTLRSAGTLEQDELDYQRYQVGFTLGGPLVQDRTHYFISMEYIDQEDILLFRPGGAFVDLAEDFEHPFDQTLGLLSFNHQLASSVSATAKLVYESTNERNNAVGGVADVSNGLSREWNNFNLAFGLTWVLGDGDSLYQANLQYGGREYENLPNSDRIEEWFSSGQTLRTGASTYGHQLGDGEYWELRNTYHRHLATGSGVHDLKLGASVLSASERAILELYQEGLFVYATDDRSLPLLYLYAEGSSEVTVNTEVYSLFVQDDWRPSANLSLSWGLRYDYDSYGNNPDFTHPLVGERSPDDDNLQPRVGFSWDLAGDGKNVLRGGAGLFVGRYLLWPMIIERQGNGVSGRVQHSNFNGMLLGLPSEYWLDPSNPRSTGVPLAPDIYLVEDNLEAPESVQASIGFTHSLGDTGLYLDAEAVWMEGDSEIVLADSNFGGNSNPVRFIPDFNQINMFSNSGRSEYKALVLSLNGALQGGHIITGSVTFADKKNIADDFFPVLQSGYPNDPANLDAEWARGQSDEELRVVLSGVLRLPWNMTIAPIFEYGSGQPWNHILGYDFNGDGMASDRPPGVPRNSEDGPSYQQLSLRLTKTFFFAESGQLDLILESFNLFDRTNYDVTSVDNAEYLLGPTIANPEQPYVENPGFGAYRATLSPREIQLGLRYRF